MPQTIKDCPFCGSSDILYSDTAKRYGLEEDDLAYVEETWAMMLCNNCKASSSTKRSEVEARISWNVRVDKYPSVEKVSRKTTIIKENVC